MCDFGGKVTKAMEFSSACTVDELGDYLLEKDIPPDIVTNFTSKRSRRPLVTAKCVSVF